ncbi:MAG: hypothetical protein ACK46Q_04985 [Hyphomonas sp.]
MTLEQTGMMIKLEAQVSGLKRDMDRATQIHRRSADQLERRARQSAERMAASYAKVPAGIASSFAGLSKLATPFLGGLAGGILGGLATDQIVRAVRGRLADISETIGKAADRASIGTEALQGLQHGFELSGVAANDLNGSLERFAQRVGEAGNGTGALHKVLDRYRLSVRTSNGEMKSQIDLLKEVADLIRRAPSDQERTSIAQAAFGNAGRAMVLALKNGSDGLDQMIQHAREGGFVLEDELVRRAEQLDDQFHELTKRVGVFGKRLAVTLADAAVELTDFRATLDSIFASEGEGRAILGDQVYDALAQNRDVIEEQAEALRQLDGHYARLADEAATAGNAMRGAIGTLDSWGYHEAADALRAASAEMDELAQAFQRGEIDGETLTERMAEVEASARAAFAELDAGDRVQFSGVISQLERLGGVIGGIISLAASMKAAIADAAGVGAASQHGEALRQRHAAEQASLDSLNAQREATERFTAAETARNSATSEHLRLQREIEATRSRAEDEGATLTARQIEDAARASLAADDARREAERAARSSGGGKGGKDSGSSREKLDEYAREAAAIRDKTRALEIEAVVLAEVATSQRQHGDAAAFADAKTRLLAAASAQGRSVTAAQMAEIDKLADSYSRAGDAAAKAGEQMREATERAEQNLKAGADGLTDIFGAARQGADALSTTLQGLADQIMNKLFRQLIMGFAGGGGTFGNIVSTFGGALGGFADGGFTGPGHKYKPAGIVHAGEYVLSKEAVANIGVGNLEALHQSAKRGYSGGGLVGTAGKVKQAVSAQNRASGGSAQNITLAPTINVNASGGTPEQNADLAQQISAETEKAMRSVVRDELIKQQRPGAMFGRRK